MKSYHRILCTVVVSVLTLSAVVSPQQAIALERVHPGTMCVKATAPGANIARLAGGSITNNTTNQRLLVSCDVVNEVNFRLIEGWVLATDRHQTEQVDCILIQSSRNPFSSAILFFFTTKSTTGSAGGVQFLHFFPPDPGGLTGDWSNQYYACSIPPLGGPAQPPQRQSTIHSYIVVEE
jgi:hypothetical protein